MKKIVSSLLFCFLFCMVIINSLRCQDFACNTNNDCDQQFPPSPTSSGCTGGCQLPPASPPGGQKYCYCQNPRPCDPPSLACCPGYDCKNQICSQGACCKEP